MILNTYGMVYITMQVIALDKKLTRKGASVPMCDGLESACSYTFTYAEHLFNFSFLTLQQLVVRAKFCVFGDKGSP